MQVQYYVNRMETKMKQIFPQFEADFYYSRRKKLIHLALNRSIEEYPNYQDFLKEIELFFESYFRKEFQMYKPIRIIHTIKWKFDYVIFRKRT